MLLPITSLALSTYNTETGHLAIPELKVNDNTFYDNVAIRLNFATDTFELVSGDERPETGTNLGGGISTTPIEQEVYRVRLFFGLSLPDGGAVSLYDWEKFQNEQIAQTFEGYNIVDSTGFYQGKPERSKIATFIVEKKDILKLKKLAKAYAQQFQQESVMMVVVPVLEWSFIGAEE